MNEVAKVVARKVKASSLKPGDLFSTQGPEYWDTALDHGGVGEKVYMRTNGSCPPQEKNENIYKIVAVREKARV